MLQQTLGQVEDVLLDAAHVWIKEIRDHAGKKFIHVRYYIQNLDETYFHKQRKTEAIA